MNSTLIILPDFLLILLGTFLAVKLKYSKEFWKGCERLVFYVLFPPLLFLSVSTAHVSLSETSRFLGVAVFAMMLAVLSSYLIRFICPAGKVTNASVFQCGFRFNTYIGFAICLRLFGDNGFSLLAMLIAIWVPISNVIAVSALASAVTSEKSLGKRMQKVLLQVFKNPLIIATLLGLFFNVFGLRLPDFLTASLKSLGNASLAAGLLCIGASLTLRDLKAKFALISACTVQRLLIVPLIAWLAALVFGLDKLSLGVLVLFAALRRPNPVM